MQNNAARMIYNTRKFDHVTHILKELHWLPIYKRIEYKILIIVYKCINGTGPKYLSDMLEIYQPGRFLRSSSNGILLKESKSKLATGGARTFSKLAPKLWNKLPLPIRNSQSLDVYKRSLKTHFFAACYSSI